MLIIAAIVAQINACFDKNWSLRFGRHFEIKSDSFRRCLGCFRGIWTWNINMRMRKLIFFSGIGGHKLSFTLGRKRRKDALASDGYRSWKFTEKYLPVPSQLNFVLNWRGCGCNLEVVGLNPAGDGFFLLLLSIFSYFPLRVECP